MSDTQNPPQPPINQEAFFLDRPWTWKDRLRCKLFPAPTCPLPKAPPTHKDTLVTRSEVNFALRGRLMLILTGRLAFESKTVTQNVVGHAITSSICYPLPPKFMEPKEQ